MTPAYRQLETYVDITASNSCRFNRQPIRAGLFSVEHDCRPTRIYTRRRRMSARLLSAGLAIGPRSRAAHGPSPMLNNYQCAGTFGIIGRALVETRRLHDG